MPRLTWMDVTNIMIGNAHQILIVVVIGWALPTLPVGSVSEFSQAMPTLQTRKW
ncbi:MAG: hypothetical protein LDL41_17870 [Coleofasciculus sp. S288]|nr:hypothetical protein [Coleofasciculus sp. S288]